MSRDGRSPGFWRDAARRFRSSRIAGAAASFVGVLAFLALFAPFIAATRPIVCRYKGAHYFPILAYYWSGGENPIFSRDKFRGNFPKGLRTKDPESWALWPLLYQDPYRRVESGEWPDRPGSGVLEPPSARHLFGTDELGRDVCARVLFGTRTALLVGFVSMGIAAAIGLLVGGLAGYCGGKTDVVLSRLIELMMSIPTLVLVLALMSVIERPGIYHLMAVIGLTRWESVARYTRGELLRLKECDFVLAARALGAPWHRILLRHMLPNALAPVFVTVAFGIAGTILLESALSFLGFGAPPPTPSWGAVLKGWHGNLTCWWLAVFPGVAVFLTVLAYNVTGDGLQEAMDPRLRR
ncbi:MAG: ABC transporter permease [Planctomycetes bacterium]|nr:ABC transporter permease [Planctomycetota bacterium]